MFLGKMSKLPLSYIAKEKCKKEPDMTEFLFSIQTFIQFCVSTTDGDREAKVR